LISTDLMILSCRL